MGESGKHSEELLQPSVLMSTPAYPMANFSIPLKLSIVWRCCFEHLYGDMLIKERHILGGLECCVQLATMVVYVGYSLRIKHQAFLSHASIKCWIKFQIS